MVPPCAWLSKWERVEGAASSFAAELAREIVHGRSFRALAFANHMENGRKVFWKMGRVVGVADGDSSAGWCAQASWGHCDMRCEFAACTRPFGLSVPMRSMQNGLGDTPGRSFGKLAGQIARKAHQSDCLDGLSRGHCGLAGFIWQKTPLGGLVAGLGFCGSWGNS